MDGSAESTKSMSAYAVRAAKRARMIIVCGLLGTSLAVAIFLFLCLFPSSSGREYSVLILMVGWAAAGIFFTARGFKALRHARDEQLSLK